MNMVVITGSPHSAGTSALLAEQFIQGAQSAGHRVFRFDAGLHEIQSCIACETCHKMGRGCIFQDDMEELNAHLLTAEAIVFVSSLYYFDVTPQLRTCIGRFYANDQALHGDRKTALLLSCENESPDGAKGAVENYYSLCRYFDWTDYGVLIATDCATISDMQRTDFPARAEALGAKF